MKIKYNYSTCRLKIEFIMFSDMKDFLIDVYKNDPDSFIKSLKEDRIKLLSIKANLEKTLEYCKTQLAFVENFLDEIGVNPYE